MQRLPGHVWRQLSHRAVGVQQRPALQHLLPQGSRDAVGLRPAPGRLCIWNGIWDHAQTATSYPGCRQRSCRQRVVNMRLCSPMTGTKQHTRGAVATAYCVSPALLGPAKARPAPSDRPPFMPCDGCMLSSSSESSMASPAASPFTGLKTPAPPHIQRFLAKFNLLSEVHTCGAARATAPVAMPRSHLCCGCAPADTAAGSRLRPAANGGESSAGARRTIADSRSVGPAPAG